MRTAARRAATRPAAALGVAALALGLAAPLAGAAEPGSHFSQRPLACAQANGRVEDIAVQGSTVYFGGSFTSVTAPDGTTLTRLGAAAIDSRTCAVLPWNPSVGGEVMALAVGGTRVYLGGKFSTVGGQRRHSLASVDTVTAAPTSFAPQVRGKVEELAVSTTTLYAAGGVRYVGSLARGKAAAFSVATGDLLAWDPQADKRIDAMALAPDGSRVYLGGVFTMLHGDTSARHLAAVDPVSAGVVTGFRATVRAPATEIRAVGAQVAVGFAGGGGTIAVMDTSGQAQLEAQTDGNFQSVALVGDEVVGGGHFGNFCPTGKSRCDTDFVPRHKALSLDVSTGGLTGFNPDFDSTFGVWALAYDPGTGRLFAGGDFTRAGSTTVTHLAVFGP